MGKQVTSISVDSDRLDEIRRQGINLSDLVNRILYLCNNNFNDTTLIDAKIELLKHEIKILENQRSRIIERQEMVKSISESKEIDPKIADRMRLKIKERIVANPPKTESELKLILAKIPPYLNDIKFSLENRFGDSERFNSLIEKYKEDIEYAKNDIPDL